jgi:hypothetical protein
MFQAKMYECTDREGHLTASYTSRANRSFGVAYVNAVPKTLYLCGRRKLWRRTAQPHVFHRDILINARSLVRGCVLRYRGKFRLQCSTEGTASIAIPTPSPKAG